VESRKKPATKKHKSNYANSNKSGIFDTLEYEAGENRKSPPELNQVPNISVGKCCVHSLGGPEVIDKEDASESEISKDKGQHQVTQTSPYEQQKYRQIVNDQNEVTSMYMDVVLSVEDLIHQKFTSIEMLTEEAMHFKVGFKSQYGKKSVGSHWKDEQWYFDSCGTQSDQD